MSRSTNNIKLTTVGTILKDILKYTLDLEDLSNSLIHMVMCSYFEHLSRVNIRFAERMR